jgi:hypothetical protein
MEKIMGNFCLVAKMVEEKASESFSCDVKSQYLWTGHEKVCNLRSTEMTMA